MPPPPFLDCTYMTGSEGKKEDFLNPVKFIIFNYFINV